MLDNIYVVTDLGPGDGGKGSIIHSLSCKINASIIIKRGGAQGSHGVCTSSGEKFNFSQWGCGTLEGIPTYCSEQMIISPIALENESNALKKLGIYDPYVLLSVNPSCICSTPYHMISSQIEEILLGNNPRGTIGSGVGRAYRMYKEFGDKVTIFAYQLADREQVYNKLKKQLDYYRERYARISRNTGVIEDDTLINENLSLLHDNKYISYIVDAFEAIGHKVQIKEFSEILKYDGQAIVECSHGVLTDSETGLKPHVSAIRTLPKYTCNMLKENGYNGKITNLAVHRAYEIRHGAGPIPTYSPEFTNQMLPGSHKDKNRWQGIVRAGALDINLMQYALESSKETTFDGIGLTWLDQILNTSRIWSICTGYKNKSICNESYTNFLKRAEPIITDYRIKKPISTVELFDFVKEVFSNYIKVPLSIISFGPTEVEKIYH